MKNKLFLLLYLLIKPFDNILLYFKKDKNEKRSILLMSHEFSRTGAPVLLLYIAKELNNRGYKVLTVSKKMGPLFFEFRKYSSCKVILSKNNFRRFLLKQYENGTNKCICNTTVVGSYVKILKEQNFFVINLIHEMQKVIKLLKLEDQAREISLFSDCIIFPSSMVYNDFKKITSISVPVKIKPQGIFLKSKNILNREDAKKWIKEDFKINKNNIFLNVAKGEYRKGFDLFIEMAIKNSEIAFLWIGDYDKEILNEIKVKNKISKIENLYLPGYIKNPEYLSICYRGSDLFLLTSREEPFGSIVLESMNAETPIIAFHDAGGFVDVIKHKKTGILVEFENIDKMLFEATALLQDKVLYLEIAKNAKEVLSNFTFEKYIDFILHEIGED